MNIKKKKALNPTRLYRIFIVFILSTSIFAGSVLSPIHTTSVEAASSRITITQSNIIKNRIILRQGSTYSLRIKSNSKSLKYEIKDHRIAKVSKNGLVTGKKPGTTSLFIKLIKSGKCKTKKIKVKVIKKNKYNSLKSLKLSVENNTLLVGEKERLYIDYNPSSPSNADYIVKTNKNGIISISNGWIKAKKAGEVTLSIIACENNRIKDSIRIKVRKRNKYEKDTDGDGYSDYTETKYMGTDPTKETGDGNSLPNKIVYSDNVFSIPKEKATFRHYNNKNEEVIIPSNNSIKEGSIVAIEPCHDFPVGKSLKVSYIEENSDGTTTISGTAPEIQDVITYANINEEMTPDWNNILLSDGIELESIDNPTIAKKESAKNEKKSTTKIDPIKIKLRINHSAKTGNTKGSLKGGLTITIDKVNCSFQATPKLNFIGIPVGVNIKKLDLSVGGESKLSASVEGKIEKDLSLAKVPIVGGFGTGLYFEIKLHAKADGSLSLNFSTSQKMGVMKNEGERINPYIKMYNKKNDSQFSIECAIALKLEATLKIFGIDIVNYGTDPGIHSKIKTTVRINPPMTCIDLNLWIGASVYAEFLPGIKEVEMKIERIIFDEKNSPLKTSLHFEDGKLVDKCTYNEENENNQDDTSDFIFEPWKDVENISYSNAILAHRVYSKRKSINSVISTGIELYNNEGTKLKTTSSEPIIEADVLKIKFDTNDDLKYILRSGTTYKYRFFVVLNEKILYGNYCCFTTKTLDKPLESGATDSLVLNSGSMYSIRIKEQTLEYFGESIFDWALISESSCRNRVASHSTPNAAGGGSFTANEHEVLLEIYLHSGELKLTSDKCFRFEKITHKPVIAFVLSPGEKCQFSMTKPNDIYGMPPVSYIHLKKYKSKLHITTKSRDGIVDLDYDSKSASSDLGELPICYYDMQYLVNCKNVMSTVEIECLSGTTIVSLSYYEFLNCDTAVAANTTEENDFMYEKYNVNMKM